MSPGKIVQSVELWSPKPTVGGSNPSLSVFMKLSFSQILLLFGLGILFFADIFKITETIKQKIKSYNKKGTSD